MLSAKQQKFIDEYMLDLNATKAAIRAGYSPKTADSQGWRLLKKAEVVTRVEELKLQRSTKTLVDAEYVVSGLKEVANRCLQKAPVMDWDYEKKEFVQKTDADGNGIWEFDSMGANKAFELLGKHAGVFEKDNNQKRPMVNLQINL